MVNKKVDLKELLLLASFECSGGDLGKTFTFEELLVQAWQHDPVAWGLRAFEHQYPDSERLHRELDSRGRGQKGIVDLGLLEKTRARVYRLTPKGLATAARLRPTVSAVTENVGRMLEAAVRRVLEHPTFQAWLRDPHEPKRFRDAGHFWGIAPGTPPGVISERIRRVYDTLDTARDFLDGSRVEEVATRAGAHLYDRSDIHRCVEFQETLLHRFSADLKVLGVDPERITNHRAA